MLKVGYNKAVLIEGELIENGMIGELIGTSTGRAVLIGFLYLYQVVV